MQKRFDTINDYHRTDQDICVRSLEGASFRIGLLSEVSNDIKFTSTDRNGIVVDLTGTLEHLTRMDGIDQDAPTHPGDVCLIPPGLEVHLAWTIRGARQSSIMVEFDNSIFEHYTPELVDGQLERGHLIPENYTQRPEIASIARLLAREVEGAKPQGRIYTDSVLRLLALEIAQSGWSVPARPCQRPVGRDPRISRAVEFVEAHYMTDVSLLDIGRAAGLSPTHLTSLFQRETGQTPYSYVIDRRVKQATYLLRNTDLTIAQVSYDAGFADQQHMTRAFSARLGRTPKAVRCG